VRVFLCRRARAARTIFRPVAGLALITNSFLGDVGLVKPAGEQTVMPIEMIWSRPTRSHGMWKWLYRRGFQDVLPSQAHARRSAFRLVGTQDPVIPRKFFRKMVTDMMPRLYSELSTRDGLEPGVSV